MNNSRRKLTAILLVVFLILGALPLLMSGTGAQAGDSRDAAVTVKDIRVKDVNQSSEGKLEPGTYNVTFDFNAAGQVELNVTIGVCPTNDVEGWDNETHELWKVFNAGNHTVVSADNWTFTAQEYWVNVTIGNGTNTDFMNKTVVFEDVYNVTADEVILQGDFAQGKYPNASLNIVANVNNTGNKELTANITVNITVVNSTGVALDWQVSVVEGLLVGGVSPVIFAWVPPEEGSYAVNVTWNCTQVDGNATKDLDANVSFVICDVVAYDATLELVDDTIDAGNTLDAWLNVTNTGNVARDFEYNINITKTDWYTPDEVLATGEMQPGETHSHPINTVMSEAGAYTITVYFNDTGTDPTDTFDVIQVNHAPSLDDETTLAATIYAGDTVPFIVAYEDDDNDAPDFINVSLGKVWNATSKMFGTVIANYTMVAENETDVDYTDGNNFTYEWTAVEGTDIEYAFITSDGEFQVEEVGTSDFDVLEALPVGGEVSGRVSHGTGNNTTYIEGAKVVIYQVEEVVEQQNISGNLTNVTVNVTTYFNATTDANGNFTKTLDFGEYTIFVNATGYKDSNESDFELTVVDAEEEIDFALAVWEPAVVTDTTGELGGFVLDADGAVVGATVTVVIYTEATEQQNISGNLTNVTVKTYANLTATSNATGVFLIEGITPGTWSVMVEAAGYGDHAEDIIFTTALTEKNFTLTAADYPVVVGPFVDADGNAVSGAVVKFSLNLTRALTEYTATTNATGFATFKLPIAAIPADTEMTITKGDWTATWKFGVALPKAPGEATTHEKTYGPWLDFAGWELSFVINNETYNGTVNDTGYVTIVLPLNVTVPAGHDFVLTKGDEKVEFKEDEVPTTSAAEDKDPSLLWLWIVLAIVVVAIIGVAVFFVTKKKPAPSIDLEDEQMEDGLGEDFDDDMEALDEEEDFSDFESEGDDAEFDGVDDLESELEEFDEDEDLGFEDEDIGDYEDEFGEEEFDEDLDEDFDDDFDDDLDDDF